MKSLVYEKSSEYSEALQAAQKKGDSIEIRKTRAGTYANREITLMYWETGHYINSVLLVGSARNTERRFSLHCRDN